MVKIEVFEKYTERYEKWFERNRFVYESELEAVRKVIPKGKGIEIGVGTGRFASPLEIKYGIEPSRKMGKIAEERGIKVICGVAEKLPLKDSSFDFVLMITTICFVDDIRASFQEVRRVLKPGGYFLAGFIDRESIIGRAYQKNKDKSIFYKEADFYSTDEIINLFKETGFSNFGIVQTVFHDLEDIKHIERAKEGYGEGSFVVIRAVKGDEL
ncbi:MAG: methyltransferase domain-containing protein [Methanomicrobia archaeon]|nr:methyltransferase domain-containing protein [Methanomicrobia archaeon]